MKRKRKIWFTADTHFNHGNIMRYCNRPGLTSEEQKLLSEGVKFKVSRDSIARMNTYLLDNINSYVHEDDVLYHNGDVAFGPKEEFFEAVKRFRDQIRCKEVHLVIGNHDVDKKNQCHIGSLFSTCERMSTVQVHNHVIMNCHYVILNPLRKAIVCYGHSHSSAEPWLEKIMPQRKAIDVGVDNAAKILGIYRPFDADEIIERMDKRTGYVIDHHN